MPSNSKFVRSFDLAGVYMIRNKVKGKVYIGSSRDVMRRLKSHEKALQEHKHPNKEMQSEERGYNSLPVSKTAHNVL